MVPFDRLYMTSYWSASTNIASVSECTWTLSALEALRNALYKFKTYLPTYLLYLVPCLSYMTVNNIVTLKSGIEVTQRHSNWYHSKAVHSNYGSILHHFGDKARYWSKIVIFSYPPCIQRPH